MSTFVVPSSLACCTSHNILLPQRSYALLSMYLKSDTIKAIFGNDGGEKVLHFIRNYIVPQEQSYCFYLRKRVRHFETTTNSGHEGTNNAIKAGPSSVLPQHGIDKSVKIQVDTDSNKFDLYQRHMASALFGRATWSNSPTVNDVTLPAEFMLNFANDQCENYASWRTSTNKWLVVRSVDRSVHSLIPCFHRVYTITSQDINKNLILTCDCNYFECNGMVCPHMVHVRRYYSSESNISHHDISVRWWKAYIYFLMKKDSDCSPTEKQIKQRLESIRQEDCKGPTFIPKNDDHTFSPFHRVYKCGKNSNQQFRHATEATLSSLFQKPSVIDSVINYSRDEVEVALKNAKKTVPVSMSQEIHLPNQIDNDYSVNLDDHIDNFASDILIESATVETDCIDFGSRLLHHDEHNHEEDGIQTDICNAYDIIMARAKELVSLVEASKNSKERSILVEEALDNIIANEKANLASEKPPLTGGLVSACPVGKVRKTYTSNWHF